MNNAESKGRQPAEPAGASEREAFIQWAATNHGWPTGSRPPMTDRRFDSGHLEVEFATFLAGVRHGRS